MDVILIINAGSSSLKFQVFNVDSTNDIPRVIKGQFDSIGTSPRLKAQDNAGVTLIDQKAAGKWRN